MNRVGTLSAHLAYGVMQDSGDAFRRYLDFNKNSALRSTRIACSGAAIDHEWVIKNGFAEWFGEEMRTGRAVFPLAVTQ
jgi:hypothetical protein